MKIINKELALLGLFPPTPYKTIDLLKVVKKRFRFTSNKLDYVAQQFGLGKKTKHQGHELWLSCMNKDAPDYDEAWALMEEYNCNDVILTEALYEKIKGWIPNHPSFSVATNSAVCTTCGSTRVQWRGYTITKSLTYRRFQCQTCGHWDRSKVAERADRSHQLVGIT